MFLYCFCFLFTDLAATLHLPYVLLTFSYILPQWIPTSSKLRRINEEPFE